MPKRVSDLNHILMRNQYPANCRVCKERIEKDTKIWWSSKDKSVYHFLCFEKRF